MALVYRSSKQQILKPVHNLGPGSYNLDKNNNNRNQNVNQSSVFASSTKRDPFDYKISEKEVKKIQSIQQNDTISQQQQPNTPNSLNPQLIKKYPNYHHVFNSKVQRFPQENQVVEKQQNNKQKLLMEEFKKNLLKDISKVNKGKLLKNKDKIEKQNQLKGQNYQFFPSVPNWDNSFGYRYDPLTTKWVANQNPKIMVQLIQSQKEEHKINLSMGAGYYVAKNQQKISQNHIRKDPKQQSLADSMIYPKIRSQYPASNSIQQNQFKLKARIRLLGRSPLQKTSEKLSKTQNFSTNSFNQQQKDKKKLLVNSQILKKFGEFIPENQRLSPSNYLEKLMENKQNKLKQKVSPIKTKKDNEISPLHFLSKSYRFSVKDSDLIDASSIIESNDSSVIDNSSMVLKSHNCKQTLLLGEKRFKENHQNDPLGPGTYNYENVLERNKSSPCLNLKQKRFDNQINKNDAPGPGDYDVTKNILKNQTQIGNIYSNYKQYQKQVISKNLKREDSMETLYQSWGRQMNYIAKLDQGSRPQQSEVKKVTQKPPNEEISLIKVRNQLQKSLKITQFLNQPKKISEGKNANEKISQIADIKQKDHSQTNNAKFHSKIYPKVTKHLYEYKKIPDGKKVQNMGPGKYETRPQMIKKTFNVTYT